ncbi:GatB YqeY domain protein [Amylolactobacillus amylotrophicus DSM 20534]|uniref:Uncharacterized protein n=3 Tax=Amylolactobacillus TaxID=2767876 RepID=A0A1L6XA21_9LACO|nr:MULTISPECIES: GatB/YqeY domain-containing protein [Amylolactobacillus]APT17825.1 hypothetical protein LA20533_00120 [Amylolactobacillus amylophilus DSM 20533 = JCM 1125]APT19245.1 hypothetical protein LA20533_08300 [Amylolactobacillus amylophilus DSM 20533 = JCM 1125]KRK38476.1 GatB YqeY domain protein [Amylolactobacillus amylotrophicus DSM 20534]KRM42881.1 GatB YqeY domain protein [Amylolactobacillus amylophilus DSM 20533 = JCM 1125]GED79745.1 hypothetical protein LAM01_02180 [Amylolactoba
MLNEQIMNDLKTAMKAHDKVALDTIRMIKSALANKKIELGHDLTEEEEVAVLSTEMKQRRDSLAEFEKGNRTDLVEKVQEEMKIVERYLPAQMSAEEVGKLIDSVIEETGATGKADFGKVMKTLMPKVKGKADGGLVNQLVNQKLS